MTYEEYKEQYDELYSEMQHVLTKISSYDLVVEDLEDETDAENPFKEMVIEILGGTQDYWTKTLIGIDRDIKALKASWGEAERDRIEAMKRHPAYRDSGVR